MNLQTYGKLPFWKRTYLEVKDRFRINPQTEKIYSNSKIKPYIPKLNKIRFTFGILGAIFFIVVPLVTPLAVFPLMWGIK